MMDPLSSDKKIPKYVNGTFLILFIALIAIIILSVISRGNGPKASGVDSALQNRLQIVPALSGQE